MMITPLGSLGWIPTGNNHTCCYCLEIDGRLVILDAGTGIARFGSPVGQAILKRYDTIYLVLSHYHLDHISGLIYCPAFLKDKRLHIAGPGGPLYPAGTEAILKGMIQSPYFALNLDSFPMDLHIHDLTEGSNTIDGLSIDVIPQQHSHPSIGVKIDGRVCYMTDTGPTEYTVDFCRNTALMMHECFLDQHDSRADNTHTGVADAARMANEAGAGTLMLVHQNPLYPEKRLLEMERFAQTVFPRTLLAKDCISVVI